MLCTYPSFKDLFHFYNLRAENLYSHMLALRISILIRWHENLYSHILALRISILTFWDRESLFSHSGIENLYSHFATCSHVNIIYIYG